jgi:hypothetical protein
VDCNIRELAEAIARVTGFQGRLGFDASKPVGIPRKLMDVSRLRALVWQAGIGREDAAWCRLPLNVPVSDATLMRHCDDARVWQRGSGWCKRSPMPSRCSGWRRCLAI